MNKKADNPENRRVDPQAASSRSMRREEWLLDAVRHLFVEAMADRRR